MGFLDLWRRKEPEQAAATGLRPRADYYGASEVFYGFSDPRFIEFMQSGAMTGSGVTVSVEDALKNPTVFRCVALISNSIGMLPLHLLRGGDFDTDKAVDHPLYPVLYSSPNEWQTAFDFRSLLQLNALVHGDGYALVVRSRGRILRLVPLDSTRMDVKLNDGWKIEYKYRPPEGGQRTLDPEDVFHLRGLSRDGLKGMSLVRQAAEAIGLAIQTEKAAARLFRNGLMVGGALTHPGKLGPEGIDNLRQSLDERYSSAENAHKWLLLEEGMRAEPFSPTAKDSQHIETRRHQIEEIARTFGVPRPLLMIDDTSWGSGIDVLGQFFVRYGLNQWFTAWEQAISRTLLSEEDRKNYTAKFNEGALLRGNMAAQGEFFSRALGSGGGKPWMTPNEVRALMNMPPSEGGDELVPPTPEPVAAPAMEGQNNEPAAAA